jgi:CBS domain-containing protein
MGRRLGFLKAPLVPQRRASGGPVTRLLGAKLLALLIGSGFTYFFDPRLGRARRARAKDRAVRAAHMGEREAIKVEHRMTNRSRGLMAQLRSKIRPAAASDEVIAERARSALGRVCSRPGAIEIAAVGGRVTLQGSALEREHAGILRAIGHVRGVEAVEDRLSRHLHPLEGGGGATPGDGHKTSGTGYTDGSSSCDEIMKRQVQVAKEDETIQHAAEKMALANVGFLPVCDSSGRVIGTITDRDIAIRIVARNIPADSCPVREVMTAEVVSCRPDDPLKLAEQFMAQHQVSRVVITDETGHLDGVISLSDIAEREPPRRAARTMRAVAAREAPQN